MDWPHCAGGNPTPQVIGLFLSQLRTVGRHPHVRILRCHAPEQFAFIAMLRIDRTHAGFENGGRGIAVGESQASFRIGVAVTFQAPRCQDGLNVAVEIDFLTEK